MNIEQAAAKWGVSVGWARKYVDDGLVKGSTLVIDTPVPYYSIPDNAPRPELAHGRPSPEEAARRKKLRDVWQAYVATQRAEHKKRRQDVVRKLLKSVKGRKSA